MSGPLALVGGMEWQDGCTFDRELLEASGGAEVVVLPTAAAYEHPQRAVETATHWFSTFGGKVRGLMVLARPDAEDADNVAVVRDARFIYLGGGSPLHLRSVLKDSPLWEALVAAWSGGAVLAGSSAGAMVLCDPMMDPRGGAFTLGLGLVNGVTVIPHANTWSHEKARRTFELAPADCAVIGIDEQTALIRSADGGGWKAAGAGNVAAWLDGRAVPLDSLP
jgi:cyanophycinase